MTPTKGENARVGARPLEPSSKRPTNIPTILVNSSLSLFSGLLSGAIVALFLLSLEKVTALRQAYPELIYLLPFGGLVIGFVFYHFARSLSEGVHTVLDEVHRPQKILSIQTALLLFGGTLVTHLFGGSAGREGTAMQLGASFTDQLSRYFKINPHQRAALLSVGLAAGFAAAIGAPVAGVIFALEVTSQWRRWQVGLQCAIGAFASYQVMHLYGVAHPAYPTLAIPDFNFGLLMALILAGVIFGLIARVFEKSIFVIESLAAWLRLSPVIKPFCGGLLLVILYLLEGSFRYTGLGIETIESAFFKVPGLEMPVLKLLLTSLTLATGFKGGEFTPLVFMGATLGSGLSVFLSGGSSFLAALGFAAVFAGAARVPLAGAVMAMEIFGPQIGIYALPVCLISHFINIKTGGVGLYHAKMKS